MGVFDSSIALAKRLVAKYGEDCSWIPAGVQGGGVPGYPNTTSQPASIAVKIAWFNERDLSRGRKEILALMPGMEVPANCEVGLLAGGLTFEPTMLDTVTHNGTECAITALDKLAPNGTPILYYITVAA